MKKTISCLLLVVFCISLSVPALATDNRYDLDVSKLSFIDAVGSKVSDLLSAVEIHKSYFGMGDVDFSMLSLGSEIPSYELTENGLSRIPDMHYFPILSYNEWVATAIVSYSIYGDMNVELSDQYTNDYVTLKDMNSAETSKTSGGVALVFDKTNAYLYIGNRSQVVGTFSEITTRTSRDVYSSLSIPKSCKMNVLRSLEVPQIQQSQQSLENEAVWLGVPSIVQPTGNTCWAASIASIVNYYGGSATVASVLSSTGQGSNIFVNVPMCASYMKSIYNLSWGKLSSTGYFYNTYITMDNLKTEMYSSGSSIGSPIFAGFGVAGVCHAEVLQGYVNTTSKTVSYMDPDNGSYKASTVPTNGAITITYAGNTLSLDQAFAVYNW